MIEIPISKAREIAEEFDYDQIIIIGRKVESEKDPGGEHVTTYGVDDPNSLAAALIGNHLKYNVMGWARTDESD